MRSLSLCEALLDVGWSLGQSVGGSLCDRRGDDRLRVRRVIAPIVSSVGAVVLVIIGRLGHFSWRGEHGQVSSRSSVIVLLLWLVVDWLPHWLEKWQMIDTS